MHVWTSSIFDKRETLLINCLYEEDFQQSPCWNIQVLTNLEWQFQTILPTTLFFNFSLSLLVIFKDFCLINRLYLFKKKSYMVFLGVNMLFLLVFFAQPNDSKVIWRAKRLRITNKILKGKNKVEATRFQDLI